MPKNNKSGSKKQTMPVSAGLDEFLMEEPISFDIINENFILTTSEIFNNELLCYQVENSINIQLPTGEEIINNFSNKTNGRAINRKIYLVIPNTSTIRLIDNTGIKLNKIFDLFSGNDNEIILKEGCNELIIRIIDVDNNEVEVYVKKNLL